MPIDFVLQTPTVRENDGVPFFLRGVPRSAAVVLAAAMKVGLRFPSDPKTARPFALAGLVGPVLLASLANAQTASGPPPIQEPSREEVAAPGAPSIADPTAAPTTDAPSTNAEVPSSSVPAPAPTTPERPLPPPPAPEEKEDAPTTALPVTPEFGTDTRSGHFYVALDAGLVGPFGEVARGLEHFSRTGPGFAPALEVSYGVGRSVSLGVYGSYALFGEGSRCSDCSSSSLGAGAFLRYHLVTGLRLDPWLSFGLGVRTLSTSLPGGDDRNYAGLEFARAQIGGDWFMTKNLFLGPFLGLGAGTFFGGVPRGEVRDDPESTLAVESGGIHWRFETGLRIGFDFPGK